MAHTLPSNVEALIKDFESSLSSTFLSFLTEARQATPGVKKEKKGASSLFLASACLDFLLFDGCFMKRPEEPFDVARYLCSISETRFYKEASSLLDSLQAKEGSRIILEGQKALFPSLCLEALKEEGMIEDETKEAPLLESLYAFAKANIAPFKERCGLYNCLCNVSMIVLEDGKRGKEELIACASRIENELKEHSSWTKKKERETLARDMLAVNAHLNFPLVNRLRGFNLDSTVSVEKELIKQANRHLKMYNRPPWNANTEYGQWLYCFALLFASPECLRIADDEAERKFQWRVIKEVFKDNPAMNEALGDVEGGEDFEMEMLDFSFRYATFLFGHKETFGIASEKEIPVMVVLMCNAGLIEELDAWGDPKLKEIYSFAVTRKVVSEGEPLFFDHFVSESALASPKMRIFFGAALGSIALSYYLNTGSLDFASLGERAVDFYKRLLLLSEGNLSYPGQEDAIEEIMDDEQMENYYANIAYFRTIAARHLEESASFPKANEA